MSRSTPITKMSFKPGHGCDVLLFKWIVDIKVELKKVIGIIELF